MKTVSFTETQLTDLIEQLETSFNQTTGEDDLQLKDYFGTLTALRGARTEPTEVKFADELSKMVQLDEEKREAFAAENCHLTTKQLDKSYEEQRNG